MLFKAIKGCRICGNSKFVKVLNLGNLALTGVFPKKNDRVEFGPLEMIKCKVTDKSKHCGLLQLRHNYNLSKLYGDNYGYRSGLNQSMVTHLTDLVSNIEKKYKLKKNDLVIDIGSNDGTTLKAYKNKSLNLIGIDPTIKKFSKYYPEYIRKIPDFFSADLVRNTFNKKAKVITSIAMFYDLESPLDFMQQIYDVLADNGIWVFEQSYTPLMIKNVSYDTICHEHLEYYAFKQIKWMTDKIGFKIIDVDINDSNGASFRLTVAKKDSDYHENKTKINNMIAMEAKLKLEETKTYKKLNLKVKEHRKKLVNTLKKLKAKNKKIFGFGASTKGSVILQFCKIDKKILPYIAEVNEYKFGRLAPGTDIPIISEKEAKSQKPDYFLVLPWHFEKNIVQREKEYLKSGGKLIFPLPKIKIV